MNIFFALYQTYVRVRDQLLGCTPLLFKYCPVVLGVKIKEPLYPLHRLYLSTPCCYSEKNSACWIVHSNQVCGVRSYYIKKRYHRRRSKRNVVRMRVRSYYIKKRYHRRRSKRNVVRMHGTIRGHDQPCQPNMDWTSDGLHPVTGSVL